MVPDLTEMIEICPSYVSVVKLQTAIKHWKYSRFYLKLPEFEWAESTLLHSKVECNIFEWAEWLNAVSTNALGLIVFNELVDI